MSVHRSYPKSGVDGSSPDTGATDDFCDGIEHYAAPCHLLGGALATPAIAETEAAIRYPASPAAVFQTLLLADALRFLTLQLTGAKSSGHAGGFASQAEVWSDPVGRRRFLQLMGASLALAGVSGCAFQPPESIVPAVQSPEQNVSGKPLFFASALTMGLSWGISGLIVAELISWIIDHSWRTEMLFLALIPSLIVSAIGAFALPHPGERRDVSPPVGEPSTAPHCVQKRT